MAKTDLEKVLERAVYNAQIWSHEYVTMEHLAHACLKDKRVKEFLLENFNFNSASLTDVLENYLSTLKDMVVPGNNPPKKTLVMERILNLIFTQSAMVMRSGKEDGLDLLLALLQEIEFVKLLQNFGLNIRKMHQELHQIFQDDLADLTTDKLTEAMQGPAAAKTKGMSSEKILKEFCTNINKRAADGNIQELIGRDDEVNGLAQVLARRTKNNVILVGDPGVGKSVIVEGVALKIVQGNVPDNLKNTILYNMEIGALVAGTRFRGDLEERIQKIIKAMEEQPNAILFIDEIHTIMGNTGGSQNPLDISNMLKPALSRGTFRVIGATTDEEFRKHFEKDRALMRRFNRLDIIEPSVEDAKKILLGVKGYFEKHHSLTITNDAVSVAVELSARFIINKCLPDKAIDVIDAAMARQRIRPELERITVIDVGLIEEEVSKIAKTPVKALEEDDSKKVLNLESDLKRVVFGQDAAITVLTNAVYIAKAGLRDEEKTQGAFLFTGPTGCGKTEAARQLALTLGIPLVRFDMSEYQEKHSVAKLVGSPPGYVGFEDGKSGSGLLINKLEQTPHCVLLLDEIEKADPSVLNVFLQIMDYGMLTASNGKNVSARNVFLIMTSNLGAKGYEKHQLGFGNKTLGEDETDMKQFLSPEFRNRLDAIVSFNRLDRSICVKITEKFIGMLRGQMYKKGIAIDVSPDAIEWLTDRGFSDTMGARPLNRKIDESIRRPLARLILESTLAGKLIKVNVAENRKELVLEPTVVIQQIEDKEIVDAEAK